MKNNSLLFQSNKSGTCLYLLLIALLLFGISCKKEVPTYDATGAFEAEDVIISAQGQGEILGLNIEEGATLNAGQVVGYIDSTQLVLKKQQLEAQIAALLGKKPNVPVQLSALEAQLESAEHERSRIQKMVQGDAATPKQLDDINAQIKVIQKQINAQRTSLNTTNSSISKEATPLRIQIEQIEDQLAKCRIINPLKGTVLTKYAMAYEIASPGKPLYQIADLSSMILRVYISGNQLSQIKLNQNVTVKSDDGKGGFYKDQGTVTWINDKAEFTPKTIQTKDERANLVYAVKIKVKNDGRYKIGMYGEIQL